MTRARIVGAPGVKGVLTLAIQRSVTSSTPTVSSALTTPASLVSIVVRHQKDNIFMIHSSRMLRR